MLIQINYILYSTLLTVISVIFQSYHFIVSAASFFQYLCWYNNLQYFQYLYRSFNMHLRVDLLLSLTIMDISFLIDLFKFKHINQGVVLHCHHKQNLKNVHKIFNSHGIFLATVKMNSYYKPPSTYPKIGVILHTSCEGWTRAFNSIPPEPTISWIVMTGNLSETTDSLKNYSINVDSDVTVAYTNHKTIELYEVFNTGTEKGTFIVRYIGYWSSSLNIALKSRKDLHGAVIRIPVVSLRTDKIANETIEHYMKRGMDPKLHEADIVNRFKYFILMKYLREMFNISYKIERVDSWGYIRNGSFDGMVGALARGDAEIAGSAIFFRADRAQYLQYVAEVWNSRHYFIFRHPRYPGGFYTIYTRPLSVTVWRCSVALLALTAVLFWVTMRTKREEDSTLSLAVLTIWGAFCQQSSYKEYHASSVKLVLFSTFVCALTVCQYYNATIVSSLLQEPPKNIRTLKDLLHSDLKLGVNDVLFNRDYFKNTKDPLAIELYNKKIVTASQHNFLNAAEGMALVKRGGFAFHVETTFAFPIIKDTFTEREICETSTVELYPVQKMGAVVRRFSPYKEHVAYGIRKIYEAGLPVRVQAVTDTPMAECVRTPDVSVFCVNIKEFSTPLFALFAGTVAAVGVFVGEVVLARVSARHVPFNH